VRVRFSHGLRDFGEFDLGAVPRGGELVLPPGEPRQLRVWNVAWRLDGEEPVACVFLMAEPEYRAELEEKRR
jgi:hypothetical protein